MEFEVHKEDLQRGSCMSTGHISAEGCYDHKTVIHFKLGSFMARLCRTCAKELAAELRQGT